VWKARDRIEVEVSGRNGIWVMRVVDLGRRLVRICPGFLCIEDGVIDLNGKRSLTSKTRGAWTIAPRVRH
jgi:hypothetical protein